MWFIVTLIPGLSYGIKTQNYKNLFDQFEFVVCCSSDPEVKNGKPHPDAFDIARKRFDPVPEPKNCLAFEDSINGVKSAISYGSRFFQAFWLVDQLKFGEPFKVQECSVSWYPILDWLRINAKKQL